MWKLFKESEWQKTKVVGTKLYPNQVSDTTQAVEGPRLDLVLKLERVGVDKYRFNERELSAHAWILRHRRAQCQNHYNISNSRSLSLHDKFQAVEGPTQSCRGGHDYTWF